MIKTNVRVVAATNVNLEQAIVDGKFREDLYYRLNSIPIKIPPLRERIDDIYLLFRKFANDFALRYRMPPVKLDDSARMLLEKYRWPGNIRQLKNITEQISVIEKNRLLSADDLRKYLPSHAGEHLPAVFASESRGDQSFSSEREILYKVLFDMKRDVTDLKKLVLDMIREGGDWHAKGDNARIIQNLYSSEGEIIKAPAPGAAVSYAVPHNSDAIEDTEEFVEESLSLEDKEKELIEKALEKHGGRRKNAAHELGISERTLYRKIKEYEIKG
jgi:transcriptional regulator with PAS, ATPase and Fis domain